MHVLKNVKSPKNVFFQQSFMTKFGIKQRISNLPKFTFTVRFLFLMDRNGQKKPFTLK